MTLIQFTNKKLVLTFCTAIYKKKIDGGVLRQNIFKIYVTAFISSVIDSVALF